MSEMNRREFGRSGLAGLAGLTLGGDPNRLRQGYGGPPKHYAKAEAVALHVWTPARCEKRRADRM